MFNIFVNLIDSTYVVLPSTSRKPRYFVPVVLTDGQNGWANRPSAERYAESLGFNKYSPVGRGLYHAPATA